MEKIGENIAFIPLRAGSKSIPGKNHQMLAGKPLFAYSVEACLNSDVFDLVVIATNSDIIKELVEERYSQSEVLVYNRSEENATDQSSTESVMLEFSEGKDFDFITLVQATSPLTTSHDFEKAWEKFSNDQLDSLLSVVEEKRFYWKDQGESGASPLNYDPLCRPRRQDFEGSLVENGAFYITSRESLLSSQCRLSGKVGVHIMAAQTAVEIDEPEDFIIVENLLLRQKVLPELRKAAKDIKLVLTDVDGVLTDAGMYYSEHGDEVKKFNTRDGKGFELLKRCGYQVGIITGEHTQLVSRRAEKLKVDYLYQGAADKLKLITALVMKLGLTLENVAFIGDDINDLDLLKSVGLSFCPLDAQEENKKVSQIICQTKGGEGCFREMAEYLLKYYGR